MVTVPSDGTRPPFPRVVNSDDAQEHFLVRFPRVGSTDAMPRPKAATPAEGIGPGDFTITPSEISLRLFHMQHF